MRLIISGLNDDVQPWTNERTNKKRKRKNINYYSPCLRTPPARTPASCHRCCRFDERRGRRGGEEEEEAKREVNFFAFFLLLFVCVLCFPFFCWLLSRDFQLLLMTRQKKRTERNVWKALRDNRMCLTTLSSSWLRRYVSTSRNAAHGLETKRVVLVTSNNENKTQISNNQSLASPQRTFQREAK